MVRAARGGGVLGPEGADGSALGARTGATGVGESICGRPSSPRRGVLALIFVLVAACEAEPLTEIVVVADTDLLVPSEIDAIRIVATDEQAREQEALAPLGSGTPRPVTLGLVSSAGNGTLEIVIIGERGGIEIMRRTARVTFQRGRTLALRADLWRRCTGELCGAESTCGDDGCRSVDIDPSELVDWTGAPPDAFDASVPRDASVDGGRAPRDASAIDAGLEDAAPSDARVPPDAPMIDAFVPECEVDEDCEDEWTCTMDACESGRCTRAIVDSACDDGIACTSQRCDEVAGCVYVTNNALCDDGVQCTTDSCDQLFGCRNRAAHPPCGAGSYCDTTAGCSVAPTFTEIYTSVIAVRCAPCHTTSATRGGMLDLATQELAYDSLVGTVATCGAGVNTRVVPGDSTRSLLWRKVAGVDLCGSRMPRGMLTPLSDPEVAMIARWIQAGALE